MSSRLFPEKLLDQADHAHRHRRDRRLRHGVDVNTLEQPARQLAMNEVGQVC
jgi:hypothetical protein